MFRERFSSVCVCHLVLVLAGLVAAARADVPVQLVGRCPSYWVRGVQVAGNYAYVADFSGLRLVDISNPALPVFVGTCPGEYTMGFALSAPYVYQGDWWYDQALGYGWGCFQVYDITNPAGPVQTGAWCDYDYTPLSVAAAGGYAYVVDGNYILQVWGVSDPAAPTVVGECSANASDLAISGGYLYAAGAGLGVFDISNPVAPVQVGGCALPTMQRVWQSRAATRTWRMRVPVFR